MKLYEYYRSSCSYRLRIGLNLKGIEYESTHINLLAGEQRTPEYRKINPQGTVPTLIDGDLYIYQSLAALEYMDEKHPESHPFYPESHKAKAKVRSVALAIACDIQPLNNTGVLNYLTNDMGVKQEGKTAWYKHWVEEGLKEVEQMLSESGKHCYKDSVTMADICLVPQVYNAIRFECDVPKKIMKLYDSCNKMAAFKKASPDGHPNRAE